LKTVAAPTPASPADPGAAVPLIELDNIKKSYQSGDIDVEVLHGISLKIYPGEFIAIMGASGSGKTTLMNILGCLDRPSAGRYRFMGEDVSGFGRDELARLRREAFGFVFQSYNLIATATAVENVEVPAIYSGIPLTNGRFAPRNCSPHWAWVNASVTAPASSRVGNSSACPSHAPS